MSTPVTPFTPELFEGRIPTPEELNRLYFASIPGIQMYWPGDEWLRGEFCAREYCIPPDRQGTNVPHPTAMVDDPTRRYSDGTPVKVKLLVKGDGNFSVPWQQYGVIYGDSPSVPKDGHWVRPIKSANGPLKEETGPNIVAHLEKHYGPSGLIRLTGNPQVDEPRKKAAREKWLESRAEWALAERRSRSDFLTAWKHDNPGRTDYPSPSPNQLRAEKILLEREKRRVQDSHPYVCSCGYFSTDQEQEYKDHVAIRHPEQAQQPVQTAPQAPPRMPIAEPIEPKDEFVEPDPDEMARLRKELQDAAGPDEGEEIEIAPPVKRGPGRPPKVKPIGS